MSDDHARFSTETAPFRRELLAHCYRMSGSPTDAEDLVQDTYLRAWRSYAAFERRASMRSWLYKIATNVCLSALEARRARVLPSSLGPPWRGDHPPDRVVEDVAWLEPLPDVSIDPAASLLARESLRLALIATLQTFPARQRAIFLLREVAAFSADETADALDTTVAAVKSGLQRARAQLDALPAPEALLEPSDPRAQELLAGYVAAFERADPSLLLSVLRADATLEATPFRDYARGRAACIDLLSAILSAPGAWRLVPTSANVQPAASVFRNHHPAGLVVLSATPSGISHVTAFHH